MLTRYNILHTDGVPGTIDGRCTGKHVLYLQNYGNDFLGQTEDLLEFRKIYSAGVFSFALIVMSIVQNK